MTPQEMQAPLRMEQETVQEVPLRVTELETVREALLRVPGQETEQLEEQAQELRGNRKSGNGKPFPLFPVARKNNF